MNGIERIKKMIDSKSVGNKLNVDLLKIISPK